MGSCPMGRRVTRNAVTVRTLTAAFLVTATTVAMAGGPARAADPRPAISLWPKSARPGRPDVGADSPVELGVRIRSDVPGRVIGIRFYKAAASTGKHVVSLWTADGALLAQATAPVRTASGWQRADFARPVAVDPGKLYVASYHAPRGHYSVDYAAFAGKGVDRPPLHAPADGVAGPNGVHAYGPPGTFPTQGYRSANYWVDVVFRPARTPASELVAMDVSPRYAAVGSGNVARLTATGKYGDGSSRDVTSLARWSSDDTTAVSAGEGGLAKAVGRGAATVTATIGTVSGPATVVSVEPPPESRGIPAATAPGEMTIATTALPDGMLGVAYAARVVASGGTPPYVWAVNGELPPGLRLDGLAGVILGTPAAAGSSEVRVTATDAGSRSAARTLRIAIGPASYSIWPRALEVVSSGPGPDRATEAGVRFKSEVAGYVVGVRFHRGAGDSASQVVHLWTGDGDLLAEARSDGQGVSGWQEVPLPRPVAIDAGASYVASRQIGEGRIAVTRSYFEQGVANPPLHVDVGTPANVGGVFAFGHARAFPTEGFHGANPWVDVVFVPSAVPPALTSIDIRPRDPRIALGEPRQLKGIGADSRGGEWDLTRLADWDSSDPAIVSMEGVGVATPWRVGEASIRARFRGVAGVTRLVAPAPPPLPDEGPGGPLLILAASTGGFSHYLAEILRTEGLNEFLVTDVSRMDASLLALHDLVILGDVVLTEAQVTTLSEWVMRGGNLVAMRPDPKLTPLLGLREAGGALSDAYLRVVDVPGPGKGFTSRSLQFHGTADLYDLDGATAIAELLRTGDQRAGHPAVTLRRAGQGQAAAFAYDLARSVVYTRQGNPAWSRQARSGATPRRPHDLFYGAAAFDPRSDWVDFSRIDVPQADEQQRLLVNLILHMNQARKPLPRFWYLPSGHRAAVVMTGDDHSVRGPMGRLEECVARSRPGCSVEDWECVRGTSYLYPGSALEAGEAQRYASLGFEISVHVSTDCADFDSRTDLESLYTNQLSAFASSYPGVPHPRTVRTHCVTWSDYDTQPKVELAHGIRLDTNYYYYPPSWVRDRPGFMTGSALPMRFADRAGRTLDVFQVATQMTDESGQTYPRTIEELLRNALGPAGYYGVFAANMHTDDPTAPGADAILAAAQAKGVPVISARQLLDWLDARNGSSFESLRWEAGVLSFKVNAPPAARNLQAMLPQRVGAATLTGIQRGRDRVPFVGLTAKGVQYAMFPALAGEYEASYGTP